MPGPAEPEATDVDCDPPHPCATPWRVIDACPYGRAGAARQSPPRLPPVFLKALSASATLLLLTATASIAAVGWTVASGALLPTPSAFQASRPRPAHLPGGYGGRVEYTRARPAPVRQAAVSPVPARPAPTGTYTFALQDAELPEIEQAVSVITSRRFISGDRVRPFKASFVGPDKMTKDEVYSAFLGILAANGLTVVPQGSFQRIVDLSPRRMRAPVSAHVTLSPRVGASMTAPVRVVQAVGGLRIVDVPQGSLAALLGLRRGDILASAEHLPLKVVVERPGASRVTEIELGRNDGSQPGWVELLRDGRPFGIVVHKVAPALHG
jgi:hypothetical protein